MTEQEKELLRTYKEKVEIQEEIIKSQKQLINKLEHLKELQEEKGMRIAYRKGFKERGRYDNRRSDQIYQILYV